MTKIMADVLESLAKWAATLEESVNKMDARVVALEMALAASIARPEPDCGHTITDEVENRFPSITKEKRSHVDTACAAYWMGRKAQTLRQWACLENGPLRPLRVNGRLAWSVEEIRKVMRLSNSTRSK